MLIQILPRLLFQKTLPFSKILGVSVANLCFAWLDLGKNKKASAFAKALFVFVAGARLELTTFGL